tara:strand:- start:339 stop:1157 length:819 start_codon:yes stop_codon:yes gene_type:complete
MNYSLEELNNIYKDEKFLKEYNNYKNNNKELQNLRNFLDGIEINKKYFRLEMNNKKGYKKKYKNNNLGDDTIKIKEITSLLNKITDKTFLKIRQKIKNELIDKDYLCDLIIENILEKCIIHTLYINLYLELITFLYSKNDIINKKIEKLSDKLYDSINNIEIEGDSDYLKMCSKNKKLDKLIGHSILITELEKNNITSNKIDQTLDNLLNKLDICDNNDDKYKYVQCVYNIFKSYYEDNILPEKYNNKLKNLIENESCMKIKFKMMDILERK